MMLSRRLTAAFVASCAIGLCASAYAADPLGISAEETYKLEQQTNNKVLFVDVRDPVEIMFTGNTDVVDANIPYMLVDRTQWDAQHSRFRMYQNPNFAMQVEAALKARGLDKDAPVITMCRSGSERGLPSAEFLQGKGFRNARYVINGFQGSAAKEGDKAGMRVINGWQNSGLPWSAKLNPEKIYRVDLPKKQ